MGDNYYIPIRPSTSSNFRTAEEGVPYNTPDFWSTVMALREGMFRILAGHDPSKHELPRLGADRAFDKSVKSFVERNWGTVNNMTKAEQIARLNKDCFAEVEKIAANRKELCKSQHLTGYTFLFLKPSYSDEEMHVLLKGIVNGTFKIAKLNKEYREGPGKGKKGSQSGEILDVSRKEEVEKLRHEIEQVKKELWEEKQINEGLRKTLQSRHEIEQVKRELWEEKQTNEGLRKTLQSNLREKRSLQEEIENLVSRKEDMRLWYEKKIRELEEKISSMKQSMLTAIPNNVYEDQNSSNEEQRVEKDKEKSVKANRPVSRRLDKTEHATLRSTVQVTSKNIELLLEDVQQSQKAGSYEVDMDDFAVTEMDDRVKACEAEDPVGSQPDINQGAAGKKRSVEEVFPQPPSRRARLECDIQPSEWVAVFYLPKFYVGRVLKVETDGKLVIRFLDQRPGETFQYRNDEEEVQKTWVFQRDVKVHLKGRKGFGIEKLEDLRKEYEEVKKKYILKNKVENGWDMSKHIPQQVIATIGKIQLTVLDLKTLQPSLTPEEEQVLRKIKQSFQAGWLNDEVINATFQIIEEEGRKEGGNVVCASTFFFPKLDSLKCLDESSISKLGGWFDEKKLKKSRIILFPLHKDGNHWVLGVDTIKMWTPKEKKGSTGEVVKKDEKIIAYYDSLGQDPIPSFFVKIRKFLSAKGIAVDKYKDICAGCPQQGDFSSCGVFMIENAKRLAKGRPLNYSKENVTDLRYDIACALLENSKK